MTLSVMEGKSIQLSTAKPKKIVFDDDGEIVDKNTPPPPKKSSKKTKKPAVDAVDHKVLAAQTEAKHAKPKKIVFDEDGEIVDKSKAPPKKPKKSKKSAGDAAASELDQIKKDVKEEDDAESEEDYYTKRQRMKQQHGNDNDDGQKKWFNVYTQYPSSDEILDIKENEQMELFNACRSAFQAELGSTFSKRNPSDFRWLQTALHKGTAKDRANAGALLVTSNPLGNLEALTTLISFTKPSNKGSTEVISILTDLWREVLLPTHRKLIAVQARGLDWKLLRKDTSSSAMSKEQQRRILAYWHFENELKDQYFEFLKNLQLGMQTGQENNKNAAIVTAAQLLSFAPEKEQMLLSMLVNKLGDPTPKIASKALHHLTGVAHKHPNMCGVIVNESEKLLFRNNISERAQHFALCFLASIAPAGRPEVCTKLVNICFALFKVLVQRGAVNNRTMQAILRCLQKAILEAQPAKGSTEILSKDMQDTIYRLVHLADIRVSVQTLGLLLQLVSVRTAGQQAADRFYNALYKKLLDLELINIGTKTAAQLLHIVHRAIHIDVQLPRAQAFIKRLLQLALCMPPHVAAGCLIVINKLLRMRKELLGDVKAMPVDATPDDSLANEEKEPLAAEVADNEADGESVKQDEAAVKKSLHARSARYDPFHRVPLYAGAQHALRTELLLLREHYHPTVQVFADSIMQHKRIDYYGDPLRDFGLPHFLERFAFKNPKKLEGGGDMPDAGKHHRAYVAFGSRGRSVRQLRQDACTEDEMFIFNYLESKRARAGKTAGTEKDRSKDSDEEGSEGEEESGLKAADVDDEEFEDYLDGFFGKKAAKAADEEAVADEDDDDEELDFLKELMENGELKSGGSAGNAKKDKKKTKRSAEEGDDDDLADVDADWGDDREEDSENDDDDGEEAAFDGTNASDDETGSIEEFEGDDDDDDDDDDDEDGDLMSLDGDEDEDDDESGSAGSSDDDFGPSKAKKTRKGAGRGDDMDERNFAKKLKHSTDMSSLFAAADDFSELLEEAGQTKGHGTKNAIHNKDKSSDKQMRWEEQRRSNAKTYTARKRRAPAHQSRGGGGKRGTVKKH